MKTLREIFKRRKKPYERMETVNLNEIYVTRKEYDDLSGRLFRLSELNEAMHTFNETQKEFDDNVIEVTRHQMEMTQRLLSLIEKISLRIDRSVRQEPQDTTLEEVLRKEWISIHTKLRTPIHELGLSARAYNCLKALEIYDVANLACQRRDALTACRNLGRKCLREMETALKAMGLHLGMDLSEYGYVQTDGILARATDIIHVKKNTVDPTL